MDSLPDFSQFAIFPVVIKLQNSGVSVPTHRSLDPFLIHSFAILVHVIVIVVYQIMKLLATCLTLPIALAAPLLPRQTSAPFDGQGFINVINSENQRQGCLNAAMEFVVDDSACAVFDIVQTRYTDPHWGTTTISYDISTSAGACGDPFIKGSQYEEGGDRILLCGEGSDAENSYWGVSNLSSPWEAKSASCQSGDSVARRVS